MLAGFGALASMVGVILAHVWLLRKDGRRATREPGFLFDEHGARVRSTLLATVLGGAAGTLVAVGVLQAAGMAMAA